MTPGMGRERRSADLERRVAGDALQLAGLVRDHGPDTLHQLLDLWGPEHVRAVCIALAAAVDLDRTPQELWGWLGPVDNRMRQTVRTDRLFDGKGSAKADTGERDRRPIDPRSRQQRDYRRRRNGLPVAGSEGEAGPATGGFAA